MGNGGKWKAKSKRVSTKLRVKVEKKVRDHKKKLKKEMKKNPDMEHDDPNGKRLGPGKTGEILWRFTKAGTFDFSCLIPGHREAGMSGKIIVK